MHLCLFFVIGIFLRNNFPTESKTVTRDGVVAEAFKADAFRRITTHLIETHIVNTLGSCAFRCSKHFECVSFNFGNRIKDKHDCQLLRTDKYNSGSSYVTSTDLHYFYSVNKCMEPSPCQNNGSCYPDYDNNDYHCVCKPGTSGRNCIRTYFRRCADLYQAGYRSSGVYQIDPDGQGSFPVYCNLTTDGGGWTVFQKRFDGSVDFFRGWQDYKTGFGNLNGEFWLGLEKIHRLTKNAPGVALRVEVEDWSWKWGFAEYSSFSIADESEFYRLHVSGYSGTAGDGLIENIQFPDRAHNGMKFSTWDKDNDNKMRSPTCAIQYEGAWWFNRCYTSHLNGKYYTDQGKALCWSKSPASFCQGLKSTQMKLKYY